MISEANFKSEARVMTSNYRAYNKWFTDWNDKNMHLYIDAAWALYNAASSRRLKFTVLGGTEIRTAQIYLRNFGLTGKSGVQENITKGIWRHEDSVRQERIFNPHPQATSPDLEFNSMVGTGSILSEKMWSPMLNDALVLGSVAISQDFVVGLTTKEQANWDARTHTLKNNVKVSTITKKKVASSVFDKTEVIEAWKSFFRDEKQMLFSGGFPRVFAREVLGLMIFGYEPVFSWHQLGFQKSIGAKATNSTKEFKRANPSLTNYIKGLEKLNFHAPTERDLLEKISEFLFDDKAALS